MFHATHTVPVLRRRPAKARARSFLAAAATLTGMLLGAAPAHASVTSRASASEAAALLGREFRPTRARTYQAWRGMPERSFSVTEPLFAERIASLEQRSVFARSRLEAIRRSGMRVWVMTPEALRVDVPGAAGHRTGWSTVLNNGRDAVAVIDLKGLRESVASGKITEEQMLADLDLLIGHELFVHVGSIGPGRDTSAQCADPDPVPGAVGCSVVEENLFTFSLDASHPFRPDYGHSPLLSEKGAGEPARTADFGSLFYPELVKNGWEASPYHDLLRGTAGMREDTPFLRQVRALWERGERGRVDALFAQLMDAVRAGCTQDQAEAALAPELAASPTLSPEDRFRVRELELVRAGKHASAREMTQRRYQLMTGRQALTLTRASEVVLNETSSVSLAPTNFHEAMEVLYRREDWDAVRGAYARYLGALASGAGEPAAMRLALDPKAPVPSGTEPRAVSGL